MLPRGHVAEIQVATNSLKPRISDKKTGLFSVLGGPARRAPCPLTRSMKKREICANGNASGPGATCRVPLTTTPPAARPSKTTPTHADREHDGGANPGSLRRREPSETPRTDLPKSGRRSERRSHPEGVDQGGARTHPIEGPTTEGPWNIQTPPTFIIAVTGLRQSTSLRAPLGFVDPRASRNGRDGWTIGRRRPCRNGPRRRFVGYGGPRKSQSPLRLRRFLRFVPPVLPRSAGWGREIERKVLFQMGLRSFERASSPLVARRSSWSRNSLRRRPPP